MADLKLTPFVPDKIWTKLYPIHYWGCHFYGRTTIVKLEKEDVLLIHSPCEIDDDLKAEIQELGNVGYIVAPGNFHHLYIKSAQDAFPSATTWICPDVERKRPDIKYDGFLTTAPGSSGGDDGTFAPPPFMSEFDGVLISGNTVINEVAMFHRATSTLILVDSVENIGDDTPGTNWVLRVWWFILRMWNVPKPAPEYQFSWKDKEKARESMNQILEWDFDKVIIAHGNNITNNAKQVVRDSWKAVLEH